MQKLAIVTDSTACLPQELVEKYDVLVVPLSLIIEGQVYQDGVDMTPSEVYELQRKRKVLPTTSAASPGEIIEVYRKASKKANAILHLSLSSKLSMEFDSARQAKEMAKEAIPGVEIEVLDTRTAAGAQGFLALAAAQVAASGGSLTQAIQAVEQLAPKVHLFVTVDTLHFLAKGGRVPKAAAWAGSLLSIKPILQVAEGEALPFERIRTKPKAIKRLLEIMEKRAGQKRVHVNLMHAGVPEEAEELKKQLLARFDCAELYITEFTPVMGVHTGPGLVGLAFYSEES